MSAGVKASDGWRWGLIFKGTLAAVIACAVGWGLIGPAKRAQIAYDVTVALPLLAPSDSVDIDATISETCAPFAGPVRFCGDPAHWLRRDDLVLRKRGYRYSAYSFRTVPYVFDDTRIATKVFNFSDAWTDIAGLAEKFLRDPAGEAKIVSEEAGTLHGLPSLTFTQVYPRAVRRATFVDMGPGAALVLLTTDLTDSGVPSPKLLAAHASVEQAFKIEGSDK